MSSSPESSPSHSPNPPPKLTTTAGIDFSQIQTLLTQHQQSNASLVLPPNHPTFHRILDLLTVQGIENLASRRWNSMVQRVEIHENDEDTQKWLELQRGPYLKYESKHKLLDEGDDDESDDENKDVLPNPIDEERYERLRNTGVAMNKWEKRLMELKRYYEERGNCDVPIDYPKVSGVILITFLIASILICYKS
jgi:hypothetical protein